MYLKIKFRTCISMICKEISAFLNENLIFWGVTKMTPGTQALKNMLVPIGLKFYLPIPVAPMTPICMPKRKPTIHGIGPFI